MLRQLLLTSFIVFAIAFAASAAAQDYTAALSGAQEVPPVLTDATGGGMFTLDAEKMLHFNITFGNLSSDEISAHIHGPAPMGENAGVVFPLPLGSPKIGSVGPLTQEQEGWLNSGLLYTNIHSVNFQDGEIRGQILQSTPTEDGSWGRIKNLYQ